MPLYAAQQTKSASERLEQVLREKDKENKRLKDSFDTLKHDNESLKRKVSFVCIGLITRLVRLKCLHERSHSVYMRGHLLEGLCLFVL